MGLIVPCHSATSTEERTSDREYIRLFLMTYFRELGQRYGVAYAEAIR
jgi:hypothetical protein